MDKNLYDFKEQKTKKERGVTNEEFLESVKKECIDFEEIAIVVKHPDGIIECFYSQVNSTSLIGLLEVGKSQAISDIQI